MTSSILQSNFNIVSTKSSTTTNNHNNSNTLNMHHNTNSNIKGQQRHNHISSRNNQASESSNAATNIIYNIKNAVMESKYFKNITNDKNDKVIVPSSLSNTKDIPMNNNNSSASLALMNKIRAIESRKKRIPTTTLASQPVPQSLNRGNTVISNGLLGNSEDELHFTSSRTPKPITSSTPAPTTISPMATNIEINKLRKKFNRSQLDSAIGTAPSNSNNNKTPDQYKEKLTDTKFFSRNYKLMSDGIPLQQQSPNQQQNTLNTPKAANSEYLNNENHYFNSQLQYSNNITRLNSINADFVSTSNIKIQPNSISDSTTPTHQLHQQSNNPFNKLKLLKKRNQSKKSAANTGGVIIPGTLSKSQSNLESVGKYTDGDDDLDEDDGMTNVKSSFNSNHQLDHHKSSQTIDESYLYEIKNANNKKQNKHSLHDMSKNGLARSSMTVSNGNYAFTPAATPSTKAKSDNCLVELVNKSNDDTKKFSKNDVLPKFSKSTEQERQQYIPTTVTTVLSPPSKQYRTPAATPNHKRNSIERLTKSKTELTLKSTTPMAGDGSGVNTSRNKTKLDIFNENTTDSSFNEKQQQIQQQKAIEANKQPITSVNITEKAKLKPNQKQTDDFRIVYPGCVTDVPKPNVFYDDHLFDDNFINEEFKRLFQEDEYFREVHRKCSEWLRKHVIPNMPKITAKLKKSHKLPG